MGDFRFNPYPQPASPLLHPAGSQPGVILPQALTGPCVDIGVTGVGKMLLGSIG